MAARPDVLSTAAIAEELVRAYRFFNADLFGNALRAAVTITVQTSGRRRARLGWHSHSRWKIGTGRRLIAEVNVVAESLSRGVEDVMETLLHEMAHHYNHERKIKDTTRSGVYHNKRYKAAAELAGLICTRTPEHGWSSTSLGPRAKDAIRRLQPKRDVFSMTRLPYAPGLAGESRTKLVKWVCGCGYGVRVAIADFDARCNVCGKKFSRDEGAQS